MSAATVRRDRPPAASVNPARRWRVAALLLLVSLSQLSCDFPTAPMPFGAEPITPPAAYRDWWRAVERCSERTGAFDAVRWYSVPAEPRVGFRYRGRFVVGVWSEHRNRIMLSEHVVQEPMIVRHEMLHAILRTGSHPHTYFEARCGHLVITNSR